MLRCVDMPALEHLRRACFTFEQTCRWTQRWCTKAVLLAVQVGCHQARAHVHAVQDMHSLVEETHQMPPGDTDAPMDEDLTASYDKKVGYICQYTLLAVSLRLLTHQESGSHRQS